MTPLPTYTGRCIDLDAPRAADIVIEDLAERLVATLPRSAERAVALRKLLEGKDAAVRARLAK